MCTIEEIDTLVSIFTKYECPLVLMHTNSEYPSPEKSKSKNVKYIKKDRYGLNIGYLGHEASVSPSLMAVCLGSFDRKTHYFR